MTTRAQTLGDAPILIGLGANLPSSVGGPRETCEAALAALSRAGVATARCSRWYRSAPVPVSDQPWFVNGVAAIETALDPAALLALMLDVERRLGRVREERWGPRLIDLDLLDYRGLVRARPAPVLPHPRLAERGFVLLPLAEVVPGWRHPGTGATIAELVAALPAGQAVEPLDQTLP